MISFNTVFFGQERSTSLRAVAVAGVVFLLVFGFYHAPWSALPNSVPASLTFGIIGTPVLFLTVVCVPAVIQAFFNDGVLVSWLLAFAGVYPIYLSMTLSPWGSPSLINRIVVPLAFALVISLAVGVIGFLVGAGGRRALTVVQSS